MVPKRSKRRGLTWARLSWNKKIELTILLKKTIWAIVATEARMPQKVVNARNFLAGLMYCHSFLFIGFPQDTLGDYCSFRMITETQIRMPPRFTRGMKHRSLFG